MNGGAHSRARRRTIVLSLLLALVILGFLPLLVAKWDRHLVSLGPLRWIGLVPICLGAILGAWSALLLFRRGGGTPAPWDPPRKFVLAGPYQYVRNPIMLGTFGILFGEVLLAQSLAMLLYLGLVASLACWYVIACEEKEMEMRFGDTYLVYKARVPRWLPRWRRRRIRG